MPRANSKKVHAQAAQTSIGVSELRVWLDTRGMTIAEFARRAGIDRSRLSRILSGATVKPTAAEAAQIDDATKGQVCAKAFGMVA